MIETLPRHSAVLAGMLAICSVASSVHAAAVSYTGAPYVQGFDGVTGTTGVAVANTDGTTVPGMYTYITAQTGLTAAGPIDTIYRSGLYGVKAATTTSTYISTNAIYGLYFYASGSTASPQLGFFNSDSNTASGTGYIAAGFALTNNTANVVTSFSLNYDFILGSTGTATAVDGLAVSYAINPTGNGVSNGAGTYVAAPTLGTTVAADNTITGPTATSVSGLVINPGDTIVIRFVDTNVSGTDRSMRIDNVAINLPEPASLAVLCLGGLGLLARRRTAV